MKKLFSINGACSLAALRHASKKSEDQVLEAFISFGAVDSQWLHAAKKLGLKLREVKEYEVRVGSFARRHPKGLFLASTHNHVFIIQDGEIVDPLNGSPGLSRIIVRVWKVQT